MNYNYNDYYNSPFGPRFGNLRIRKIFFGENRLGCTNYNSKT